MDTTVQLPGLNCGQCGSRTCDEFKEVIQKKPEMLKRCIHLSRSNARHHHSHDEKSHSGCASCGAAMGQAQACPATAKAEPGKFFDSLGREFDFYLEHFPEDLGPREVVIPHNPMITREMNITVGDSVIGRPLGMSCGCPITHCGIVREVDQRTGVFTWCVTGPLNPREKGYKDIGYYIAEAYEGIITETKVELKIGARYYFQPRMCMLQWRHSGLLNYVNKGKDGYQIRLEGLFIG